MMRFLHLWVVAIAIGLTSCKDESTTKSAAKPPSGSSGSTTVNEPPAHLGSNIQNRQGELTPTLAQDLLNESLENYTLPAVDFTGDGFKKAQTDGLIAPETGGATFHFTDKTWTIVGPAVKENKIAVQRFGLKSPATERVTEIKEVHSTANPVEVDYVVSYVLPPELVSLSPYIYLTVKRNSIFKKDADGWQVQK